MRAMLAPLALLFCLACAAAAQDAGPRPAEQRPLAAPGNALPGPAAPAVSPQPAAPAAPSDLQTCLRQTGEFVTHGKGVTYVIAIANTCEQRLRCAIFANVTGVLGTTLGRTVMVLEAASHGEGAKKTYTMRVKAAGGIIQVSRDCRVL